MFRTVYSTNIEYMGLARLLDEKCRKREWAHLLDKILRLGPEAQNTYFNHAYVIIPGLLVDPLLFNSNFPLIHCKYLNYTALHNHILNRPKSEFRL